MRVLAPSLQARDQSTVAQRAKTTVDERSLTGHVHGDAQNAQGTIAVYLCHARDQVLR